MKINDLTVRDAVQKIKDLTVSLNRSISSNLVYNPSVAYYAVNKLQILGAILQAISKLRDENVVVKDSFDRDDLIIINSILDFACTSMLFEPEDSKMDNIVTAVLTKAA